MDAEQTLNTMHTRMVATYGHGSEAIPWAQIIAFVMNLISGCIPSPTPPAVKAQAKTFRFKIQFMRRLLSQGIYGQSAEKVFASLQTVVEGATDEEIISAINAASDSQ